MADFGLEPRRSAGGSFVISCKQLREWSGQAQKHGAGFATDSPADDYFVCYQRAYC